MIVFIVLALLFCAQMIWWIVFQITSASQTTEFLVQTSDGDRRWALALLNAHYARLAATAQKALVEAQPLDILLTDPAVSGVVRAGATVPGMNDSLWIRVNDGRQEIVLFLKRTFPQTFLSANSSLQFRAPQSGQMPRPEWVTADHIAVDPGAFDNISRERSKHLRMFLMEGSFFFLLIVVGGYIVYLSLKRTHQIRQEQLLFVHSITHELKIPITSINLFVDTLKRRGYDPTLAADLVPKIKEDVARLNHMIDSILQVRKLSERQIEFKCEEIDLSAALTRFTAQIADRVKAAGAEIQLHVAENLRIKGDIDIFNRVWETVVDNSLKYAHNEVIKLAVEARQIDGLAEIAFTDNGPGIPDGMEEKLFEPFFRGHIEESRSIAGSGLGLYIAREFVHRLGGTISIGNSPHGGCRVIMKFKAVP